MRWTLALRHLLVRPGRALVLLLGYGIGVAVMIVLLSVGEAMLTQSEDTALVGGGELTVLPRGVDIEALRNGGLTGLFFGIDRARFLSREMLGGPRHRGVVTTVSPLLEQKTVELTIGDSTWTVRAGADIPSAATAAGAAWPIQEGSWSDIASDRSWQAPTAQAFYDEIDHFHLPTGRDSSWAEWHYFNVVVSEQEWWYFTYMVGGDLLGDRWGGQLLVSHRLPGGRTDRFVSSAAREAVRFDTATADLTIGTSTVTQRDGVYRIRGSAGAATFDFALRPEPLAYFPPVELSAGAVRSGYVVPALKGRASGSLCARGRCRTIEGAPAYHDHNWGVWRAVTWEWGAGRGASHALLYGGILTAARSSGGSAPFFLALVDSLGVQQVYRFDRVERLGGQSLPGMGELLAPDSLRLVASTATDTLRLVIRLEGGAASPAATPGVDRVFLQLRGTWRLQGSAAGRVVADSGSGFFETWLARPSSRLGNPER
jgi:hypothetical protein